MSVFRNKHVLIAVLVAPVLAVLAYYALDTLVSEPPSPAEEGASYPLVEKPNCRWGSGSCGLVNGDFELLLTIGASAAGQVLLTLESAYPLDGVVVALVEAGGEERGPVDMQPLDADRLSWSVEIARPDPEQDRLRLVASANRSLYYGDVATTFSLADS